MQNKFDDIELKKLFQSYKNTILDDGFSHRVSQKLPLESDFSVATQAIRVIAAVLWVVFVFQVFNESKTLLHTIVQIANSFTNGLILFFQNPKIYISVFVVLLAVFFRIVKKPLEKLA